MMKLLSLLVLLVALNADASVLNELKQKPASQYEMGKLRLEMQALVASKGEAKKLAHPKYDIFLTGFDVEEDDGKILVKMKIVGPANVLGKNMCESLASFMHENSPFKDNLAELWPGLTQAQYQALEKEILIRVVMISQENSDFSIEC